MSAEVTQSPKRTLSLRFKIGARVRHTEEGDLGTVIGYDEFDSGGWGYLVQWDEPPAEVGAMYTDDLLHASVDSAAADHIAAQQYSENAAEEAIEEVCAAFFAGARWADEHIAGRMQQSKDVPGPVEPTSSGGPHSPCAEAGTSAGHLRQGDSVFIPATVQYVEENGLYVMVGIPMHGFSFAEDKTWILPVAVDPAVLKTVNLSDKCAFEYETTLRRERCNLEESHTCHHGGNASSWPLQPPTHRFVGHDA